LTPTIHVHCRTIGADGGQLVAQTVQLSLSPPTEQQRLRTMAGTSRWLNSSGIDLLEELSVEGDHPGEGDQALAPETQGGLAGLRATVDVAAGGEATGSSPRRQHGDHRTTAVLLNPFCPFSTAKVLALKATVLLLLTLLIKARVQIVAGSAIGFFLLILQTLVFLAISGGLVLAAGGAAIYSTQKPRTVGA
jgi:hypothetical protein